MQQQKQQLSPDKWIKWTQRDVFLLNWGIQIEKKVKIKKKKEKGKKPCGKINLSQKAAAQQDTDVRNGRLWSAHMAFSLPSIL